MLFTYLVTKISSFSVRIFLLFDFSLFQALIWPLHFVLILLNICVLQVPGAQRMHNDYTPLVSLKTKLDKEKEELFHQKEPEPQSPSLKSLANKRASRPNTGKYKRGSTSPGRISRASVPTDEQEYNDQNDNAHFSEDEGKESEKACVKPTVVTIGKKS